MPDDAKTDVNGFNLSFFMGYQAFDNMVIGVSPAFVRRGAACFPGWQPVFEGDSRVFLNYIDIPLMISRKFDLKLVKLVTSIGYGVNILTSASVHQDFIVHGDKRIDVREIEVGTKSDDSFRRFDQGFHFGVRLDRNVMENHFIFFETAYYLGLMDYGKKNTSKNRNLNFNVGIGYNI